jgi:hypothetical protein
VFRDIEEELVKCHAGDNHSKGLPRIVNDLWTSQPLEGDVQLQACAASFNSSFEFYVV